MSNVFKHGYAIFIGVGGNDIPGTVDDAQALYELFISPNKGAYPDNQVQLLTKHKATRNDILLGLDRLTEQTKSDPDAIAIVYYSGHGGIIEHVDQDNEYFLIPHSYNPNNKKGTSISGEEFTEKIKDLKTRKLVVLLDCCHAGGIPVLKDDGSKFIKSPFPPELIEILEEGIGQVILASSHENEYSLAGSPYSVFTGCLLNALQGKASLEKDGFARILDVLVYLFREVPKKSNNVQHPLLKKALDLGDNFPLCYYSSNAEGYKTLCDASSLSEKVFDHRITFEQRERLEAELLGLQNASSLTIELVNRLRKALAIEDDVRRKYKYEQNLLDEEQSLSTLKMKISEIERQLMG